MSSILDGVRTLRIVLLSGLGDVVHGLPVVNAIKRARPDIRITWVVQSMPAGILMPHDAIDRVVLFHRQRGARGVIALRRELRGDRPDLTLNLNIDFKSVWPTVISPAPLRLGFERGRSRDGTWFFCNRHLPPRTRTHTQDMFLEFLEVLRVPAHSLEWRLRPTASEQEEQERFFVRLDGRPVAAIVPASANPKKDWPPSRYIELVDRVHAELDLQPILIGGPGVRETEIARHIEASSRVPIVNALGDGVRRLIWLIAGSRVVIAPDTGPVHIARALGVPVVGLYGHTNPWRVGPYRMFEDLWVDAYTDAPGLDASNAQPKLGRMERITTDAVMEKVTRALTHYPTPKGDKGMLERR
ncbi:MAG: glycosyltransferase family 9 protein [Longimicrobiales bacterium]